VAAAHGQIGLPGADAGREGAVEQIDEFAGVAFGSATKNVPGVGE